MIIARLLTQLLVMLITYLIILACCLCYQYQGISYGTPTAQTLIQVTKGDGRTWQE